MDEHVEFTDFRYEEITYRTTLTKKFANRKAYKPRDNRKVTAFIPGTIMKVFAKEGHKVKKGEKLLILQAMKMDNILLAPVNGSIKKVNVKQGEVVPKNYVLIELK